jgi:hypothetical protein
MQGAHRQPGAAGERLGVGGREVGAGPRDRRPERVACGLGDQRGAELRLDDPAPPFASGHPDVADPALVARLRERLGPLSKRLGSEAAAAR